MLVELRCALSPSVLRDAVVLRFEQWREAFVPRFVFPSSRDDLMGEVVRFVAHVSKQRYAPASPDDWPVTIARRDTERLLTAHLGWWADGERALQRIAAERGMRAVLDLLTRLFEQDELRSYLDERLVHPLQCLPVDDWLPLATAYLAEFQAMPHLETEHPALIVGRWPQILNQHARLVLGWR